MILNKDNGEYTSHKWADFLDEAQNRLDLGKYEDYKLKFLEFMQEYAKQHEEELNKYYNYYQTAKSQDFFEKHYVLLGEKKLESVLSRCKIMVLTANPIEKAIFHFMITKSNNEKIRTTESNNEKIRRIISGNTAYYILKWGKYWVAHIHQTETGANKNLGSNATIYEALKHFTPNVIISLGIAFGINYKNQNIGDVIVSKRILPYSENKRDEDKLKPDRSQDKSIDDWLHVRLINANGFLDEVLYGDILTGGSVMSSFIEKDKTCLGYTNADFIVGGEMEGNALFQYAKTDGIPGVVIKGICDWGVAKNNIFPDNPKDEKQFKDSLQAFAMAEAVKKSYPLFNDKEIFSNPKNINTIKLRKNYRFVKISLVLSQIFILLRGVFLLLDNFLYEKFVYLSTIQRIFDSPFVWICFPIIILCAIFFNSELWKKRKHSKYYIDKELKN